jgi:hypothetical protein
MKRTCFLKELREEDGPKSHVACYLLAALESHIQTLLSSGCLTQSFIFNMCAELCMFDRSASSMLARKVCMRSETSIYHIWMAPPTLGGGVVVVTHRLKGLLQLALVAQLGGCSRLLQ